MNIADFKNTQFNGVVEFAHAKFDDAAEFWNTSFNDYTSFQETVFNNDTDFHGGGFSSYADFRDAEFNDDADFSVARFNDTANFEGANFGSINEFPDVSFDSTADFSGGNFSGTIEFSDSKSNNTSDFVEVVSEPASVILPPKYLYGSFNYTTDKWTAIELISYSGGNKAEHKAWFEYAEFNGYASFRGTNFSYIASFYNATFDNIADFTGVNFNRMVYFDSAKFNYFADFLGVDFFDNSSFVDAEFNGTAKFSGVDFNATDFSRSKFNEGANFEGAEFAGIAIFDRASFVGNAIFENADFNEKLSFTGTKYEKLYIRWINLTQGIVYDDLAYMSLMKNFKDLGYFEDYDSCYYAYRVAHRAVPWPSVPDWEETIRKAIDRPLEWFYGYGTKPFNAFFISLFLILAFAVFWWAIGISGPNDRTRASLKDGDDWLDGDITDILGYSFTVFLSGTKFFVDPPAQPKIEGISRPMIKWAFIIERTLGALFSVMFFMAISSTIVRAS